MADVRIAAIVSERRQKSNVPIAQATQRPLKMPPRVTVIAERSSKALC
ncbi:hypothetical protein RRSWK_00725 [Rhodopirellula sp. SWK7]|nr:hypothetical protein RRSWK_00725 [Rhodopirellula sp. SWK7]